MRIGLDIDNVVTNFDKKIYEELFLINLKGFRNHI